MIWRCLLILILLDVSCAQADPQARRLLEQVRQQSSASMVTAIEQVYLHRADWNRLIGLEIRENHQQGEYTVLVTAPEKLHGTRYTREDGKLWMYLPALRRRMLISASMMLEPWMGSDLTNQDLLDTDSWIDDYRHQVISSETMGKTTIYTIESLPLPARAVLWGRLVQTVGDDGVMRQVRFFDRKHRLARDIKFSRVKEFSGRRIPTLWRIIPANLEGQYTEFRILKMSFGTSPEPTPATP